MPRFDCKGHCFTLPGGFRLLVMRVNGFVWFRLTRRGDCHEAAWLAQSTALKLSRLMGSRSVVVANSSQLVRNQCSGRFRARKARMRAHRDRCLAIARPMLVHWA